METPPILAKAAPYATIPLRLAFAAIFLFHSIEKISNGVDGFANMMGLSIGIAWIVTLFELGAGLLMLAGMFRIPNAGLMTRISGALAVPVMIGAIAKVHWPRWSFVPDGDAGFPMGGMEFQVLVICVGLYFALRPEPAAE